MAVTVLFKVLDAARQPVRGRGVIGKLITPDGWLADHTGTIIEEAQVVSGDDGLVQMELTPQSEIAAFGTYYEIQVMHSWYRFWCVVPASASPVQLADILVDPNTLQPVPAETASIWLSRAELGQAGGVAPLDEDGLVPLEHLPAGSGGGAVDSVNGETGVVVLDAADVGAVPATRQLIAGTGLTGGGALSADRTVLLNAGTLASLGKADTAVQPGQLATVALSGSYADLLGTVPTSALPALAVTEYLGDVDDQAEMLTLTGQVGDWCIRADLGTVWFITGADPALLASWTALSYPAAPVGSVNGLTGLVMLTKADVGLGQVANLAPAAMPVSTAQGVAIAGRGVQAFATSGRHQIAMIGDTTSTWALSPIEYRVPVAAAAGNLLRWSPHLQINAGGADAELDVVSVVDGAPARYFSTGTTSPGLNGHGRLYLGPSYGRSIPSIDWLVTEDDLDDGFVTLALRYRQAGSGATIGSVLYPNHIDVTNLGSPPA